MKHRYITLATIIIIAFLYTISSFAQSEQLINRYFNHLSPSERRYGDITFNFEEKIESQLYSNPAFYNMLHRNSNLLNRRNPKRKDVIVNTSYSQGEMSGDYLTHEGAAFNDMRLFVLGEHSIDKVGTIFGGLRYSRGEHKHIAANIIRFPELYWPYLEGDRVGGNMKFTDYMGQGGYSFALTDKLFLGSCVNFRGEEAFRMTEPRNRNISTSIEMKVGAAYKLNKHAVMMDVSLNKNKQYFDSKYWGTEGLPFGSVGFIKVRGLGLTIEEVEGTRRLQGIIRMNYLDIYNVSLAYKSPTERRLALTTKTKYSYSYLECEEFDIFSMFQTRTHTIHPTVNVKYKANRKLDFSLFAEGEVQYRKGYERLHVAVDKMIGVEPDFELLGIRQQYFYNRSENLAQLKTSYNTKKNNYLEFLLGSGLSHRQERYDENIDEKYSMYNSSITPHIGVGYKSYSSKKDIEFDILFTNKKLLKNYYDVDINIERLSIDNIEFVDRIYYDFYHAFMPYAYHNNTYTGININATYTRHFKKISAGVNLKMMYRKGQRNKDTVYKKKFYSMQGSKDLSATPQRGEEKWGAISLFVMF